MLRHFQKFLALLPSDLIANAAVVIVTTSTNHPRRRLGKSLIIENPKQRIRVRFDLLTLS
jgi:hypothetical protein